MEDPNVYQEIGQLQAKVEALEKGQSSMNAKLDTLLERSAAARGASGLLWKVGGAAGTGGGLLVAIASWYSSTFGSRGGTP